MLLPLLVSAALGSVSDRAFGGLGLDAEAPCNRGHAPDIIRPAGIGGRAITEAVPIPTIGIGASPMCDGQILVTDDVLGLFTQFKPRFVRRYAELAPLIAAAAAEYAADVRARRFPGPEHCFGVT